MYIYTYTIMCALSISKKEAVCMKESGKAY